MFNFADYFSLVRNFNEKEQLLIVYQHFVEKKKSLGRCLNPEICNKSHCPNLKQLSISHLNLIVPQTSEITITDRGESMTGETKANTSKDNYFIDGRNCFITSTFSHWLVPLEAGATPPFRFWDLA